MLRLAAGVPKETIAQEVRLTRKVVSLWCDRWLAAPDTLIGVREASAKEFRQTLDEILADRPRPGAPLRVTAAQVCHIMAGACQKPEALGVPFTTWTRTA